MNNQLSGVFAALLTPLHSDGAINYNSLKQLIDLALKGGADGICIGGGTSGYPYFDTNDRKQLISRAAAYLRGKAPLVTAVGASTLQKVRDLAEHAAAEKSDALLVPAPHFYHYAQEDLLEFYRTVAGAADVPCLIYNLPAFTEEVEIETVLQLLSEEPNIVGVKDSSGHPEHLATLANIQQRPAATLLCGADELFLPSLDARWDGCISGLASCCPELLTATYSYVQHKEHKKAQKVHQLLLAFAEKVLELPFPWGIHTAAQVRGISTGPVALPLSPGRRKQINRLQRWLERWFDNHLEELKPPR